MRKKEENLIEPILDVIKQAWRHRPELRLFGKVIWPDQTIPAAVLDTIDALNLETKDGLKPILVKAINTEYGAKLILNLPPSISRREIEKNLHYFEEQVNGQIFLESKGKTLIMEVYTVELPKMVKFQYIKSEHHIPVPIGITAKGSIRIANLVEMPHILVAGNTGGGKSSFIHSLIAYLLLTNNSRPIIPVVVDLKVLEFAYLSDHCPIITSKDMVSVLMEKLNRELDRRLLILRDARCRKITEYPGDMPFIVLIIDEVAEITDKEAQEGLNRLARLARAAGIHIVAATQRPDATLFKDFAKTKALLPARLCFTVADEVNSRIVLGTDAANKIPKNIPGRAIWKFEREELIQAMYLDNKEAEELVSKIPARKGIWGIVDEVMQIEQGPIRLPPR